MKRLAKLVAFAALAATLACSNGQASSSQSDKGATQSRPMRALALAGRVTDAAHVLSAQQQVTLSGKLEQLERATGHQVVVATAPSLGGRDVADFTRDLANAWGIGRKQYDDGVVLLIAPTERKVRIAVGYGLEKTLTRDVCQQIIDQQMLPHFRNNDLPGGIEAGADAIIARLRG